MENVYQLIKQLESTLNNGSDDKICINTNESIEIVQLKDLMYVKSDNNYCTMFLKSGFELMICKNLKFMEEHLSGYHFFKRPHNSYLINLNFVTRLVKQDNGYLELTNGKQVPISRSKKKEIHDYLTVI